MGTHHYLERHQFIFIIMFDIRPSRPFKLFQKQYISYMQLSGMYIVGPLSMKAEMSFILGCKNLCEWFYPRMTVISPMINFIWPKIIPSCPCWNHPAGRAFLNSTGRKKGSAEIVSSLYGVCLLLGYTVVSNSGCLENSDLGSRKNSDPLKDHFGT